MTLQSTIENIVAQSDGHWGIFVWHVENDPPLVQINEDDEFEAASTAKLGIIVYVLNHSDLMSMNPTLTLEKTHRRGGTGVLRHWPNGFKFRFREAFSLMLIESDNTATNVVLDAIGGQKKVNEVLGKYSMEQTGLTDRGDSLFESTLINPQDAAILMDKLTRPEAAIARESMKRCHFRAGLRRELDDWQHPYKPPHPNIWEKLFKREESLEFKFEEVFARPRGNSGIANKEGTLDYGGEGFRHDVALFPNGLICAAFSRGWPELGYSLDHPALITLGKIGSAVYHWKEE